MVHVWDDESAAVPFFSFLHDRTHKGSRKGRERRRYRKETKQRRGTKIRLIGCVAAGRAPVTMVWSGENDFPALPLAFLLLLPCVSDLLAFTHCICIVSLRYGAKIRSLPRGSTKDCHAYMHTSSYYNQARISSSFSFWDGRSLLKTTCDVLPLLPHHLCLSLCAFHFCVCACASVCRTPLF